MGIVALAFGLSLVFLGSVAKADPSVPLWGGNNYTLAWSAVVNMTDPADSPAHPTWMINYFYDWRLKASRYEHGEGNYDEDCARVAGHPQRGQRCTIINAANGQNYLLFPDENFCCQHGAAWTIRSDWLQDGGTSYGGLVNVNGTESQEWLKRGNYYNHYLVTNDEWQRPVQYWEKKRGVLKQWMFMSYTNSTPPADLFMPPANCSTICPPP